MDGKTYTYASAGVDIDAADETKRRIRSIVRSTFGPEVLTDIGGFGGFFAVPWRDYENPVLVSSTDSVGTKLKVAFRTGKHDTVGIDIVAHCVNDILVHGAEPLFFLDYLGMGQHDTEVVAAVIEGVAEGCRRAGCALIGGEMAELPEFYRKGEYDLAGTIVGIVERERIVDGAVIHPGDTLIGLMSDGLHTNGYSLARKLLFDEAGMEVDTFVNALGRTVGEELLRPHRCYARPVLELLGQGEVNGMAHITGGGLLNNLPRVLPEGVSARIRMDSWRVPPIFSLLQEIGNVSQAEMYRTFNMGVGMVLIVPRDLADETVRFLEMQGECTGIIGEIVPGECTVELVEQETGSRRQETGDRIQELGCNV